MKKKVLIISESMTGGIRRHIMDYLDHTDLNKLDIHIAYGQQRADEIFKKKLDVYNREGISTYAIKELKREIRPVNELKTYQRIRDLIKRIKPDIVHCHSSKAGGVGRIAARISGIKHIYYTPHAYIMLDYKMPHLKRQLYMTVERLLSRYCTTKTINVSNGEREFAINHRIAKPEDLILIYNGIDEQKEVNSCKGQLRKQIGVSEEEILIGSAMRLYKPKDPDTYYQVAKNILTTYDNTQFVIIGDSVNGYKEKMLNNIKKDGLVNRFHLIGFRDDVESLIRDLDIYFFTSIYEGLPYSLLEALKVKMPMVVTDVTGNNDIVLGGYNGYLFEPENAEVGTNQLGRLIKEQAKWNLYGNNGFDLLTSKFTVNKMVQKIDELYDI